MPNIFNVLLALVLVLVQYSQPQSTAGNLNKRTYPEVNKCCRLDQSYNPELEECEISRNPLVSNLWKVSENFSLHENSFLIRWKLESPPVCSQKIRAIRVLKEGGVVDVSYLIDEYGKLLETSYTIDDNEFQLNHLPQHYCVDPTDDALIFRICPPRCDEEEPCIRKCCRLGEHLQITDSENCVESQIRTKGNLPLFPTPTAPRSLVEPRFNSGYEAISTCTRFAIPFTKTEIDSTSKIPFKVLTNGSIVFFEFAEKMWKYFDKPIDYCYERVREQKGSGCEFEDEVVFLCVNPSTTTVQDGQQQRYSQSDQADVLDIISKVTLVIAVLCLLATSCVHLLLMNRADPQTWIRFLYVLSEFVFLQLFVFMLSSWVDAKKTPQLCKSLAITSHFFGLMTLTWFSMYHFDSWWTFREPRHRTVRKSDVIRFFEYCLVAVGLPLLIVAIALGIDANRPDTIDNLSCRSDIDEYFESLKTIYPTAENFHMHGNCFLAKHAHLAYWFDPILIILFLNLVFFVGITSRVGKRSNINERRQYSTIILVFIVVTTTWCIDTLGWIFELDPSYHLEIVHHVEAMALFVILVCMGNHFESLRNKFKALPIESEDEKEPNTSTELEDMHLNQ